MSDTTVGAVYCVYEDSGYLTESISRIYPLVKSILILIGHNPWKGEGITGIFPATIQTIAQIPDPEEKIHVVWGHWKDEADQRNSGLNHLRLLGCRWCLICDCDELYNRAELKSAFEQLVPKGHQAYLIYFHTYWKRRDLVVDGLDFAVPCIISTEEGKVYFNENRMVRVAGTWDTFDKSLVVCHHLSYVRSDEKMLRKIQYFSHTAEILETWYENVWLKWEDGMTNFHPTAPTSFPRAIPESQGPFHLEVWP